MATRLSVSLSATSTPGRITALYLTRTHTIDLLCVHMCVSDTHRAISRYSGPTKEPTPSAMFPYMSDTGARMPPPPRPALPHRTLSGHVEMSRKSPVQRSCKYFLSFDISWYKRKLIIRVWNQLWKQQKSRTRIRQKFFLQCYKSNREVK